MPAASIYESPLFATAAKACQQITIPLPDEATNIRFAGYREWIAAEDLMRFEAPTEICLKHAVLISPGNELKPVSGEDLAITTKLPLGSYFNDTSWFDLDQATSLMHLGGGPGQAEIWIDQDRGVFYYRFTD